MTLSVVFSFVGRAAVTALVVVLASVVAETAGPVLGALAASLPVSVGPTYIFLALTHDARFVATSALGSLTANAATIIFLAAYARIGMERSRWALVPSLLLWLVSVFLIRMVHWTVASALALNAAVFAFGVLLTKQERDVRPAAKVKAKPLDWVVRAITVAVFVAALLGVSGMLGSTSIGIAAAFPVVFVLLIFTLHPRLGDVACVALATTAVRAMGGFSVMFLVACLTVVPLGSTLGLALSLLSTLSWSAALAFYHRGPRSKPRVFDEGSA